MSKIIKNKKILFVEDDETLANSYAQRFAAEGLEVKRASNGEEALAIALSFRPDIILLDIMMPIVDGFNVLDILRNTHETANTKIIVLSALSQEEDIDKAHNLGADGYLVKTQVVLADVVERIKQELGIN